MPTLALLFSTKHTVKHLGPLSKSMLIDNAFSKYREERNDRSSQDLLPRFSVEFFRSPEQIAIAKTTLNLERLKSKR